MLIQRALTTGQGLKHHIVNVYRKVQSWDAATILTALILVITGISTAITALSTFYTWTILADARVQAEIQHYNTAWLLVNSSGTSPITPEQLKEAGDKPIDATMGEIAGGGRKGTSFCVEV